MSADDSATGSKLLESKAAFRFYRPGDIWNADEFVVFSVKSVGGLFHRMTAQHLDTKRNNAYYFSCCLQHQRRRKDAAHGHWEVTQTTPVWWNIRHKVGI